MYNMLQFVYNFNCHIFSRPLQISLFVSDHCACVLHNKKVLEWLSQCIRMHRKYVCFHVIHMNFTRVISVMSKRNRYPFWCVILTHYRFVLPALQGAKKTEISTFILLTHWNYICVYHITFITIHFVLDFNLLWDEIINIVRCTQITGLKTMLITYLIILPNFINIFCSWNNKNVQWCNC